MLKIESKQVMGWEPAIRGMRNPLNSWEKSDSRFEDDIGYHDICGACYSDENVCDHYDDFPRPIIIGDTDKGLMERLAKSGKDHAKYRRMIVVYADVTAPLYWWKEYDTYKVGTVANSCSTMHKIQAKEFTLEDFSHEHLFSADDIDRNVMNLENIPTLAAVLVDGSEAYYTPYGFLAMTCDVLNHFRDLYLKTNDKRYWWQMIQLLPSSYNQRRTVMLNYEVLANIYPARRNHKLDEWHTFCNWIENLPESWIITGEKKDELS